MARLGMGVAEPDPARLDSAGRGMACQGAARQDSARRGKASLGPAFLLRACLGRTGFGRALKGTARLTSAWRGLSRRGPARLDPASQGFPGLGKAPLCSTAQERVARFIEVNREHGKRAIHSYEFLEFDDLDDLLREGWAKHLDAALAHESDSMSGYAKGGKLGG